MRFSDDETLNVEARWTTLFVHGREVAIEEGLLVPIQVSFGGETIEVAPIIDWPRPTSNGIKIVASEIAKASIGFFRFIVTLHR